MRDTATSAGPGQSRAHARAALVSSGDEIITGQLLDTNAHWVAQRLLERGIIAQERATIGDDAETIAKTLRRLAGEAALIVMTGGLGPTEGDLTRQGLALALGEGLVRDEPAHAALEARLRARGRPMTDLQARQSMRPVSSRCIENPNGTAPGLHAVLNAGTASACDVFCLPGPPGELKPMWGASVEPLLRPEAGRSVRTRVLQIVGVAEADAVMRLGELTRRGRDPLVGITASQGVLTLRLRSEQAGSVEAAERALDADEASARAALGAHVFARGEVTLARRVVELLVERGRRVTLAESCTGGLVAKLVTDVAGASAVFERGWVTYANGAKVELLGVDAALIERHGAVSPEVARAMALGAMERARADEALAITGVAGPDGGSASKPVGTVWIALARRAPGAPRVPLGASGESITADVRRFVLPGGREDVRERAARTALAMLYFALVGDAAPVLLWQQERLP